MSDPRAVSAGGSQSTYEQQALQRLAQLCHANGFDEELSNIADCFHELTAQWGSRTVGYASNLWRSDVADDHSPYEFSVVFGGRAPELRMLIEAQGEPPNLQNNWRAALALSQHISATYGVELERHDRIADLFEPGPNAHLALWHAVAFVRGQAPQFKVYFDAQAQGRWRAPGLVEEALCRLGFVRAWPAIQRIGGRGLTLDELKYLSLDLTGSDEGRVKVYWRHHGATAPELGRLMGPHGMEAPEVSDFCRRLGGFDGPYAARPVFSCTTLLDRKDPKPHATTIYMPIAAYAASDAVAVARIGGYLEEHGLDAQRYRATIEDYAERSLTSTSCMQSYVSLQQRRGRRQVTVYFSPEAHQVQPARAPIVVSSKLPALEPAEQIVARYEHDVLLADHPFLRRLAREPVNLGHLWLIMANFWEAIVHDFPARLAHVIARVDDDRVRSIVAKQLNDELGEGDFTKAHKPMFRRLLDALAPHRIEGDPAVLLAPGREFGRRISEHLFALEAEEAIGALMMIEVYGKQTDQQLGHEFRRQQTVGGDATEWLRLHEILEVDHADDSLRLARLLPAPGKGVDSDRRLAAAWRGAEGVVAASMNYFAGLYEVCFA
ncbi:MAG: iron-containing redox enzyme family protein [Deltaproteobacteria bacterium]|nr:iron-containing redox enzyme family protein [Nannocystaceae bacterium]